MKAGPSGNNMSTSRLQFPEFVWEKTYVWSPGGPRMKLTATMRPCVVWLSFFFLTNRGKMVLRTLALAGSWRPDFQTNIFQNSIFLSNHIMMKNARNMYSKKTSNSENHTKTVWQLPHTWSRTSHHYNSYVVYCCTPHTCTIVPLYILHCAIAPPTSHPLSRCTPAPHPCTVPVLKKKNIAKKQKNIAKFCYVFFCFFAMFFFENWYGAGVRCRGATGQWVRLVGTWVQFTGYMGAISWYSGATSGYIPTYWQSPVHTFADGFPYLSQLCRKNHCLKPNSRKFNLVHFALEAFSRRQNLSASNKKR